MLREIGDRLWCAEAPGRAHGVELGERMAVVKLDGDGLLLVGPIAPTHALRTALDRIGTVRHLCVPNLQCFEHVNRWASAYPHAERWAPSLVGASAQDPKLAPLSVLRDEGPGPPWRSELDFRHVDGLPSLDEVVFYHGASRSLVVTDVAVSIPRRLSLLARAYLRLSLGGLALGPTRDTRWLVTNRAALNRSIQRVLEWPFERIVVRRGDLLERGGRPSLRRAYRWLSAKPSFWR